MSTRMKQGSIQMERDPLSRENFKKTEDLLLLRTKPVEHEKKRSAERRE